MKSPQQITAVVRKRLAEFWHLDIISEHPTAIFNGAGALQRHWPYRIPLSGLKGAELERAFASEQELTLEWRDHASRWDLELEQTPRRVYGTAQTLASHVSVSSIDGAAKLAGGEWVQLIARGRDRAASMRRRFPALPASNAAAVLRGAQAYSDVDFELLCLTAAWFSRNPATGMTPRQVPIEGVHAKWLDTRGALVRRLARLDSLGLAKKHPQRAHFSYLDPEHRQRGGRIHDSVSVGDTMLPVYRPELVIIAENKDSAIHFPSLPRAIAVEGAGSGPGALAHIDWIVEAPRLIYWGDMDAAGLEIVDQYRAAGLIVDTVLMDVPTFDRYARFGAATDPTGKPLGVPTARAVPTLTEAERALYDRLTDPQWPGFRRIEQERIPLEVAVEAVRTLAALTDPLSPVALSKAPEAELASVDRFVR